MIIINKAILHILDFTSGTTVFSEQELDVADSVETFLLKHIEKSFFNQGLKEGVFADNSVCGEKLTLYNREEVNFIAFSRWIAERFYDAIAQSEEMQSCDLLVCDIVIDDEPLVGIFKCNNRSGYIHQVVQTDDGVKNEIINHYAIMPNLSQQIDEYAFINREFGTIKFVDKKATVNGDKVYLIPDMIIECNYTASPKDTIKTIREVTKKVAEENGRDSVQAIAKLKSIITESPSEYLNPQELGQQVFADAPVLKAAYEQEIAETDLAKKVKFDRESTVKKMQTHKIKTDTGIELSVPLDYFQDNEFIEFINEPNGMISINLKNIGKIVNK